MVGNPPDPEARPAANAGVHPPHQGDQSAAEIILYVYAPVPETDRAVARCAFPFPETLDEWISARWQAFSLRRDPRTPWSPADSPARPRLRNRAERVLPDGDRHPADALSRGLLRTAAAWRYHTGPESRPLELNLLQRVLHYQRPETTGF